MKLTRRWLAAPREALRVLAGRAPVAALLALVVLASGCAGSLRQPAPAGLAGMPEAEGAELIVAFADRTAAGGAAGSTAMGGYSAAAAYVGSGPALADADAVMREFELEAREAWTIAALRLHCLRVVVPPGRAAADVLARLQADRRVALAQPLHTFTTFAAAGAAGAGGSASTAATPPAPRYDDPFLGLQRGFAAVRAGAVQQWSRGEGVRVALVDTAVDVRHPDLAGRIEREHDFVAARDAAPALRGERHGTELAGVIAAAANNRIGIVGVAPAARVSSYRACWAVESGGARCNSFTLARALAAALAERSDVINLSLGGPSDPLLERLVRVAQARGAVVVGALPPEGHRHGFPSGVSGVLVASVAEGGAAPARTLRAPGRDVLTLGPGGGYDYASGSSLAAAHVSGGVALLRALEPRLDAATLETLLAGDDAAMDLCAALRRLRPALACGS